MISFSKYLIKGNKHNPWIFNGVLWGITYIVLLFIFSEDNEPKKIDFIYTTFFLITIIIPVLINFYILLPYLLEKEKYFLYLIAFVLNILIFTQLNAWFFDNIIDKIFPDYYFISYHGDIKLVVIFTIFLLATTSIKLSENWIFMNRIENEKLKIENQQIQSQLINLRSQINPHFLFNSLNVIYSLTLEKKEEAKNAIVQLSDILRYVIYDSEMSHITIKEEIKLIENYIAFQKFRIQKSKKIKFNSSIENENYEIYPMLLLPLIENSFKYAINNQTKETFIEINLEQRIGELHFSIANHYSPSNYPSSNKYSGVGIKNIEKNLQLVYPGRHSFLIEKTDKEFQVTLKLFSHEN